jgi:hypothetical protein
VLPSTDDRDDYDDYDATTTRNDQATLLPSAPPIPTSSSDGRLLLLAGDIEPPGYVYRLFTSS